MFTCDVNDVYNHIVESIRFSTNVKKQPCGGAAYTQRKCVRHWLFRFFSFVLTCVIWLMTRNVSLIVCDDRALDA